MENIKHIAKYFLIACCTLLSFKEIKAQEVSVPIEVQLEILPKILSLNKSYELDDPNTSINLGILYSSKLRNSLRVKNEIISQIHGNEIKIRNAKVIVLPIDLSSLLSIKNYLLENKIDVLYFTPLRGYDINEITTVCKLKKILTFTGVSSFANENDISVGFELENNKLQITINLESAKAEGAEFSSRLLKVSKVK